LEVECPSNYTGLWLKDSLLAWALCETAFKSGAAKSIRLEYFADKNTVELLFDLANAELVEKMKKSLKCRTKKRQHPPHRQTSAVGAASM